MSNGVPGLGQVVELAEVVRNGFVESRHFGLAVALDPDGAQVYAAGTGTLRWWIGCWRRPGWGVMPWGARPIGLRTSRRGSG
jgi:hypothetical protein